MVHMVPLVLLHTLTVHAVPAAVPQPPPPPPPPPPPHLWPLPRNFSRGVAALLVPAASFQFQCEHPGAWPCAEVLTAAFGRHMNQIFAERDDGGGGGGLAGLAVAVASMEERTTLQLGMDESYTLQIPASGGGRATLAAPTVWGALRGLETFAQLVEWDWDARTHVIRGAPWRIDDAPRFPHRSFMVDTARHYEPLAVLGRLLDGMAACKLNTLHWCGLGRLLPHHPSPPLLLPRESDDGRDPFAGSLPVLRGRACASRVSRVSCVLHARRRHISDGQSVAFESRRYPKIWAGRFSENERYSTADMAWVRWVPASLQSWRGVGYSESITGTCKPWGDALACEHM
jgi:hypothetical protein